MNHNNLERISEEANGCIFPSFSVNDLFPDLEFSIFGELSSTDIPVDGICDFDDIDIVGMINIIKYGNCISSYFSLNN